MIHNINHPPIRCGVHMHMHVLGRSDRTPGCGRGMLATCCAHHQCHVGVVVFNPQSRPRRGCAAFGQQIIGDERAQEKRALKQSVQPAPALRDPV